MTLPAPPVGVRLTLASGKEVAVQTVYVGVDESGTHVWRVVDAPKPLQIISVGLDELPPNTKVVIHED